MSRARQVANFDPALFAADEVSGDKVSGGTIGAGTWEGTDVAVAHGGTGASTHTANNVLVGAGTSAITSIAPGADGQVLTSTGSAWNSEAVAGGGVILQVLSAFKSDTFSHSGNDTVTTITGLTVDITPASTSNKILIMGGVNFGRVNTNSGFPLKLFRDTTEIGMGASAGNRQTVIADLNMPAQTPNYLDHRHVSFLDSPSTTSQITYAFKIKCRDDTEITINSTGGDNDVVYESRGGSSIMVMEVKG